MYNVSGTWRNMIFKMMTRKACLFRKGEVCSFCKKPQTFSMGGSEIGKDEG